MSEHYISRYLFGATPLRMCCLKEGSRTGFWFRWFFTSGYRSCAVQIVQEQETNGYFVVQIRSIEANADGAHVDANGHPLPPCIVMERGESLDIWAARAQPDRSQAFTVRRSVFLTNCGNTYKWSLSV